MLPARFTIDRPGFPDQKAPRMRMVSGVYAELLVHEPWLRALALRLSGNASDAQDLVQDTLERALQAHDRLRPGSNLRAWLASILNNLFLDRCRRRSREGARIDASSVEHLVGAHAEEATEPWLALSTEDVARAVGKLEDTFRGAFQLHLEGCSYEEISRRLAIPRATVGTRLLRARLRLREILLPPEATT